MATRQLHRLLHGGHGRQETITVGDTEQTVNRLYKAGDTIKLTPAEVLSLNERGKRTELIGPADDDEGVATVVGDLPVSDLEAWLATSDHREVIVHLAEADLETVLAIKDYEDERARPRKSVLDAIDARVEELGSTDDEDDADDTDD